MKKVLRSASALAAVVIAAPVAAHATDGWYGRADVGYSVGGALDLSTTPGGTNTLNGKADLKDGWSEYLGLGYAYSSGFRLEGELAHRWNELTPFGDAAPNVINTGSLVSGDVHVWSGMLNGYYDFNKSGSIQPYVGLGVGVTQVVANATSGPKPGVPNQTFDDQDTRAAYQAMVGVAIALSKQLSLDIGYRYFKVPGLEFSGHSNGATLTPRLFDADYDQHTATVGLRWQFAAPAAPPPPPPPPPPEVVAPVVQVCPAQDFKVYFEWDRSNLNAAANDTINAAAARAKQCNVSTVRVVGYTDTSGSPKYNLGLSNRRAAVVRDALVAAGIPASLVSTEGLGETNLDKQTKDGVREPLNRRTAVTISFQ